MSEDTTAPSGWWNCVGCGLPFKGEPDQYVNAYDETEYACNFCSEVKALELEE